MGFEKRKHRDELRARLKTLAARFGQAEIARRTDTAPANVHRYLREGKVPADFCAALVSEFQVSPLWLLEGRGGMLRSEVRQPIAEMGGDLLELVETMNAVSQMRLGAVAGKREQRSLRELSDSLDAFDRLRVKLNSQSQPMLAGALDQWRDALNVMDMNRAASMRLTALQLARLTTDEQLLETIDALEGSHAYQTANLARAIEFDRKAFARRVRDGRIANREELAAARNLVGSLADAVRIKEARAICRASLALTDEPCRDTLEYRQLQMFDAHLTANLGDLEYALDVAIHVYPHVADDFTLCNLLYSRLQWMGGLVTFAEAIRVGPMSSGKARMLTRSAAMMEDADCIDLCLPALIGVPPKGLPDDGFETHFARLVQQLLRGRKRRVADFDKLIAEFPLRTPSRELVTVQAHLHRAQIARLAGDKTVLKKEVIACEQALAKVPPEVTPPIEWLLPRRRNLEAVPARSRTAALRNALQQVTDETDELAVRGYRLFVGI